MEKIAIFRKKIPADWISCRAITSNLEAAYRLAFPQANFMVFGAGENACAYEMRQIAADICRYRPDRLIFLDHSPHPGVILEYLAAAASFQSCRVTIHVFGDFVLQAKEWSSCEKALKLLNARFLCASDRHCTVMEGLMEGADLLAVLPFPVDEKFFTFSEQKRGRIRKNSTVNDSDVVFLYAGRLSIQKNVVFLIQSFLTYLRQINPHAWLWLAGPADDLGVPYLGRETLAGLYSHDVRKMLDSALGPQVASRIRYWGDLGAADLANLYSGADVFASFSTHNDEDFGMAPAEAACCGMPLVLSSWGGYAAFQGLSAGQTAYIPVKIQDARLELDPILAVRAMHEATSRTLAEEARNENAKKTAALLGIKAVAARLRKLHEDVAQPVFSGFSPRFQKVLEAFQLRPHSPFGNAGKYSKLYREVYSSYV